MQPHVDASRAFAQEREAVPPMQQVVSPRSAALVRAYAANDAMLPVERGDGRGSDLDAHARHAAAANGFGDTDLPAQTTIARSPVIEPHIGDDHGPTRPHVVRLYRAASRLRSRLVGDAIVAAGRAIARGILGAWVAFRQNRIARDTHLSLDELDDRTLRDLGLNRSETWSIGMEAAGRAERTR
ncbi:MAG TPA: DUF1127 domain-containing protein, partial [Casimicrobiaceae bacterium]|nr:DUF1127 domain-containing protein [Casimicrobiaceae bacterium]